jgi:hypothetical protein
MEVSRWQLIEYRNLVGSTLFGYLWASVDQCRVNDTLCVMELVASVREFPSMTAYGSSRMRRSFMAWSCTQCDQLTFQVVHFRRHQGGGTACDVQLESFCVWYELGQYGCDQLDPDVRGRASCLSRRGKLFSSSMSPRRTASSHIRNCKSSAVVGCEPGKDPYSHPTKPKPPAFPFILSSRGRRKDSPAILRRIVRNRHPGRRKNGCEIAALRKKNYRKLLDRHAGEAQRANATVHWLRPANEGLATASTFVSTRRRVW